MKKPFVLIAAIVAVVSLCAAVAVAKETTNVGTAVKLELRYGPPAFFGSVNASHDCQKKRRVIVTHDHERVYADTSNDRGKYRIGVAVHDLHPVWNYRAVAKARKITKNDGDKIVCERGTSNPISPPVGG